VREIVNQRWGNTVVIVESTVGSKHKARSGFESTVGNTGCALVETVILTALSNI